MVINNYCQGHLYLEIAEHFWARKLIRTSTGFGRPISSSQVGIDFAMTNSVWLRTVLGFLIAPITPGLFAVVLATPFRVGATGFGLRELSEAVWIIELSAMLGYPVALVFGAPLYFFFGRVAGTAC